LFSQNQDGFSFGFWVSYEDKKYDPRISTYPLRAGRIHRITVMLMVRGDLRPEVEGLEAGAGDCLTKPTQPEKLVARARRSSDSPIPADKHNCSRRRVTENVAQID